MSFPLKEAIKTVKRRELYKKRNPFVYGTIDDTEETPSVDYSNPFVSGIVPPKEETQTPSDNPSLGSQIAGNIIAQAMGTPYNQEAIAAIQPVSSFISGTVGTLASLLNAPLAASSKFFDSLIEDAKQDPTIVAAPMFTKSGPKAVSAAIKEFVYSTAGAFKQGEVGDIDFGLNKPEDLNVGKLIQKHAPTFAKEYPEATTILGLIGDMSIDPTSYVTFGAGSGLKLAGRKLSNKGIDLVRELNQTAREGIQYTLRNKQGLEYVGTLGVGELNKLRQTTDIISLARGAKEGEASALGQLNTIINAHTRGFPGKLVDVKELSYDLRRKNVEFYFDQMSKADPELLLKGGDTGMFIRIPFSGGKRITVVSPEVVDKAGIATSELLDKLSLGTTKRLRESVKTALKDNFVINNLSRESPVAGEEVVKLRNTLNGQLNVVDHKIRNSIRDFVRLPQTSKDRLKDFINRIDDRIATKQAAIDAVNLTNKPESLSEWIRNNPHNTKLDYDNYVNSLPTQQVMSQKSIDATRQWGLNQAIRDGKLSPEEVAVYTKFLEAHNYLSDLEFSTKLFKNSADNGLFIPQYIRKNKNLADKPELLGQLDLATVYALRMKEAGYKQAYDQFDAGFKLAYEKFDAAGNTLGVQYSEAVQRELNLIGRSVYSQFKPSDNKFLKGLGMLNNYFKYFAVGARPAFATKQYFSNTLASYAKVGVAAFKNFDPRSFVDAGVMLMDNSAFAKYIPTSVMEAVQMKGGTIGGKLVYAVNHDAPQLLKGNYIVNALEEKIPLSQLAEEMVRHNIYDKGTDILSLENIKNIELEVSKMNGWTSFQKAKIASAKEEGWINGTLTFVRESTPWINLPNIVENQGKIALFINGRRMGYDAENAAKIVNQALFPYRHGLTQFERTVMRRFVPFYTFQRFAMPLMASLIKEPGRAKNLERITKSFFEVYGQYHRGDQPNLTEDQRRVVPGYLLSQPNSFNGWTQDGGVKKGIFNTFNSFIFTDWLSMVQLTPSGSIDFLKTFQKMTLGQITPLFKVPIEIGMNKNFFTQVPIKSPYGKGARISTGYLADFYEDHLPLEIQKLIGYEVDIDDNTGEKIAYVSPYLAHVASSFVPAISDFINITKQDQNAREFAMKFLGGVGTVKLDFQKEQHYRVKELQDEIAAIGKEINRLNEEASIEYSEGDTARLKLILKQIADKEAAQEALAGKRDMLGNLDVIPK